MKTETTSLSKYDPNLPATKIVAKWGSNLDFANALERPPSTTHRWLKNGYIPPSDLPAVIAAGKRDGHRITKNDLIDLRLFDEAA